MVRRSKKSKQGDVATISAQVPASQPMQVGSRVRANQVFLGEGKEKQTINKGDVGSVTSMDNEGNAFIAWDGKVKKQWLLKKNFYKVDVQEKALASQPLQVGSRVRANQECFGDSKGNNIINKGDEGTVISIDNDGDAEIAWDGKKKKQRLLQKNIHKVDVLEKVADRLPSDGSAEDRQAPHPEIVLKLLHTSSGDIKRFRLPFDDLHLEQICSLVNAAFGPDVENCFFEDMLGNRQKLGKKSWPEFRSCVTRAIPSASRLYVNTTKQSTVASLTRFGEATGQVSHGSTEMDSVALVAKQPETYLEQTSSRALVGPSHHAGQGSCHQQNKCREGGLATLPTLSQGFSLDLDESDEADDEVSAWQNPSLEWKFGSSAWMSTCDKSYGSGHHLDNKRVVNASQLHDGARVLIESALTGRLLQLHHDGSVNFDGRFEHLATFSAQTRSVQSTETVVCLRSIGTPRYLRCVDGRLDGNGVDPEDPACHFSIVDVLGGIVLVLGPLGTGHVCARPGCEAPIVTRDAAPQGYRLFAPALGKYSSKSHAFWPTRTPRSGIAEEIRDSGDENDETLPESLALSSAVCRTEAVSQQNQSCRQEDHP